MMGVPTYVPLAGLDIAMAQDERSHPTRLAEFFIKLCATARSSAGGMGRQRAFLAEGFQAEAPALGARILRDGFDVQELSTFQNSNHGNHSFGDPSRLMSAALSFVSYADILKGCLFRLTFFQYLAPGSALICVQYGPSSHETVPTGLEVIARHFASPHPHATAKFLRVDRQWQSQLEA